MGDRASDGGPDDAATSLRADRVKAKSFGAILFLSGLLAASALASLPFAVVYLARRGAAYTDVVFPLLLVVGVVSLVLVVAVLVGLFKRMDLVDRRYALGLPNGSISAIIALMLILVFAMMSVLVHINMDAQVRTISGLTTAQVDEVPAAQIIGKSCSGDICTIDRRIDRAPAQVDIGKQLVTTVSTLVVAISAFYFGSVQTASAAQRVRRRREGDEDDDEP